MTVLEKEPLESPARTTQGSGPGDVRGLRLLVVGVDWPPETFLRRLFDGLADEGVEVTVATATRPDRRWLAGSGRKWLRAPGWEGVLPARLCRLGRMAVAGGIRNPRELLRLVRNGPAQPLGTRLRSWYRRLPFVGRRWDAVYFPWNSAAIEYGDRFYRRCPIVLSCRGAQVNVAPYNPDRAAIRDGLERTFDQAAIVHCVSDDIAKQAVRLGMDPVKARIIRPAVDPDFFAPPSNAGGGNGTLRLVTTGSLIWRKGYEYALQAVRQLVDRGIRVEFEIVGDGPERQRVLYTIHDLDLQAVVRLSGRLSPEGVRRRLQQSDVFLLSSLSEGISNAVLEAMACGLPVVTTDCGGMREAVTDGREGFVVPVRDPAAMADALAHLAENGDLRKRMGQAARARVLREFTLDRHICEWLDLLQVLVPACGALR